MNYTIALLIYFFLFIIGWSFFYYINFMKDGPLEVFGRNCQVCLICCLISLCAFGLTIVFGNQASLILKNNIGVLNIKQFWAVQWILHVLIAGIYCLLRTIFPNASDKFEEVTYRFHRIKAFCQYYPILTIFINPIGMLVCYFL